MNIKNFAWFYFRGLAAVSAAPLFWFSFLIFWLLCPISSSYCSPSYYFNKHLYDILPIKNDTLRCRDLNPIIYKLLRLNNSLVINSRLVLCPYAEWWTVADPISCYKWSHFPWHFWRSRAFQDKQSTPRTDPLLDCHRLAANVWLY